MKASILDLKRKQANVIFKCGIAANPSMMVVFREALFWGWSSHMPPTHSSPVVVVWDAWGPHLRPTEVLQFVLTSKVLVTLALWARGLDGLSGQGRLNIF